MRKNSERFVGAYNLIDKTLRNIFNFKANLSFTDVVRKSANLLAVVRKHEDELISYSRLRNAIVHYSPSEIVIAEPHESVTANIERIASLISTPPKALPYAHEACTVSYDKPLKQLVQFMASSNFSNIPVIKNNKIIGVATNKLIVEALAQKLDNADEYLNSAFAQSVLTHYDVHFTITRDDITCDKALTLFWENPKLLIVILTSNGMADGDISGVITTGDLIKLNRTLEDY